MSWRFAFSPSGGLAYHFIARKRSTSSWRNFRAVVRDWLKPWLESASSGDGVDLIVFGPSAGWTLPLDLFRGLRILFVEPDPVAAWILARRLKSAGVRDFEILNRADLLPWCAKSGAFADFLAHSPRASVLFANVLGQMSLVATRTDGVEDEFLAALQGRRWASYHDVYSGSSREAGGVRSGQVAVADLPGVAKAVFKAGEVIDHETEWLGAPLLSAWPLTKDRLHVIGFVRSDD